MADTYPNFETLSRNETAGIDYGIRARQARAQYAIVAVHGGGIEPGTSEIADAIAGEEFSFYGFEGLKSRGNAVLHITSTHFDEPVCLEIIGRSERVITIHGEESETAGEGVFVGGLDEDLGHTLGLALEAKGFDVRRQSDPDLQGRDPENVCNRGTSGKGVQLELSQGVRKTMFRSLTRSGRKETTARFCDFVEAVSGALHDVTQRAVSAMAAGMARESGR